ncbi:threonine-phosphate decarboxylase CobD [Zavarzinia marina]|uniref:threonine-phosphate decarboxylase CobD n=1 Tax=Zavarzinia marina TaxID=2911065 RepID=UPI001EED08D5|nr:threonine-phosphate decarboxylase CobD [Zavarzinia marina]
MDAGTASMKQPAASGISVSDPLAVHGGRLAAARARFPMAPTPWLDLSTGINPDAYPIGDLPPEVFTRLPEPGDCARLEAVAAEAYGVADPALVMAAPGTQILIEILPHLVTPGRVAVLGPTYGGHGPAWARAGHRVRPVETLAALETADYAVLVNPNNPDGRVIPAADLAALAARMAARGGLLVVDEAFADLEPGVSVAPFLPLGGLVVLRSFGKTYGLAGLRLGFALSSPDMIAGLRASFGDWAVSGPAIAVGIRALADGRWRLGAMARAGERAARLDALMTAAGFTLIGGCRLFRLFARDDAGAWFQRFAEAGILTRPFPFRPDWLRLGVPGNDDGFARLAGVLS